MSRIIPELARRQVWFLTGSQHLYGPETLQQVALQSQQIAKTLEESGDIPVTVVCELLGVPHEDHEKCRA